MSLDICRYCRESNHKAKRPTMPFMSLTPPIQGTDLQRTYNGFTTDSHRTCLVAANLCLLPLVFCPLTDSRCKVTTFPLRFTNVLLIFFDFFFLIKLAHFVAVLTSSRLRALGIAEASSDSALAVAVLQCCSSHEAFPIP